MEYKMGLQEKYYNNMKYGSKKIEMRINDDKRRMLNIGDTIYFMLEPDRKKKLETKIIGLTVYKDFNDALNNIPIEFLSDKNDSQEVYLNDLNKFYSKEEQEEYGVLAIEIEVIEKSCGLIVLKEEQNKMKVLLVHHNVGHWGLPKGHVEGDETEIETAIRETMEETGIKASVTSNFREVITYKPRENAIKNVVFFIGNVSDDKIIPQLTEVSEAKFVEINEALNLISHEDEKILIEKAINN